MKARSFSAVLFLGLFFQCVVAAWDIGWVDQFGNGVSTLGNGATTDATGVYVSGSVFGTLPGQVGAGGNDAYLRKYDFGGTVLWTRQFGTSASDSDAGVATDSSGIYVAGRTSGILPGQTSAGGPDSFVRKYSANGDVLWTRQFGTSGLDISTLNSIAIHSTGVYVVGNTTGTFPGEPAGNGLDIFIARLDAQTGQPVWIRQFGIRRDVFGTGLGGVAVDDNGVYAASSTLQGDITSALVRKYDFGGNLVWAHELSGSLRCGPTFWGAATHGGSLYLVGQWSDGFFEDPNNCPGGGKEIVGVVLKLNSSGNLVWRRRLKGAGNGLDSFTGAKVIRASETGVYVGANLTTTFPGQSAGTPSSDRSECEGLTRGNAFADKLDAYVRRYDFDGNVIWTHQFGSTTYDLVKGIGTDAMGVYVAGDTSCRIDRDEALLDGSSVDAFTVQIAIEPTSLSGRIQLIVGRLETLNDAGRFNPGEFNSLVQHLETSLQALNHGHADVARQALDVFISAVNGAASRGILTVTEGGALIAAANAVIAQF